MAKADRHSMGPGAQGKGDGSGAMTLHDLAAVYGVSAVRDRQIEVAGMKKMKKALAAYA